jgi:hypothetical protein
MNDCHGSVIRGWAAEPGRPVLHQYAAAIGYDDLAGTARLAH